MLSIRRLFIALVYCERYSERNPETHQQNIFHGLDTRFDNKRMKIENMIHIRIIQPKDDWFMPGELSDYVAFATRKPDRSPVVKMDLQRWIRSGGGCPISRICGYALSWLERMEIFGYKDYTLDLHGLADDKTTKDVLNSMWLS